MNLSTESRGPQESYKIIFSFKIQSENGDPQYLFETKDCTAAPDSHPSQIYQWFLLGSNHLPIKLSFVSMSENKRVLEDGKKMIHLDMENMSVQIEYKLSAATKQEEKMLLETL